MSRTTVLQLAGNMRLTVRMAVVPSAVWNCTCVVRSALTAVLDWAGKTSRRPTTSSSLNSWTSCKHTTDRCDRWAQHKGALVVLHSCYVLQAKQGMGNRPPEMAG
jgi:hypothetical protein